VQVGGRLQGRGAFRKTRVGLAQRRASSRLVDVRIGDGAGVGCKSIALLALSDQYVQGYVVWARLIELPAACVPTRWHESAWRCISSRRLLSLGSQGYADNEIETPTGTNPSRRPNPLSCPSQFVAPKACSFDSFNDKSKAANLRVIGA
jgi:hypothetical protein